MRYVVTIAEAVVELDVERNADGSYRVRGADGTELNAVLMARDSDLVSLSIDGQIIRVQPAAGEVHFRQERHATRTENALVRALQRSAASASGGGGKLLASMPGRIVRVLCDPGQTVNAGTPLIVMEAMKMQNELCAKADSVVRTVRVEVGQTVERGAVLVELE
jgi:3-methylcrotonyl-CoA carboxylase alpha subunit